MSRIVKNERAFTLIELMIVVIIISILAMLTFVSFTQVQKNARDSQRKGDLQAVAGALQRFYSDNARYPSVSSGKISYNADCSDGTGTVAEWETGRIVCTVNGSSKNYLKQLPSDPQSTQYCYERTSTQNYNLYAKLEGQGNISLTPCTVGTTTSNYNYRVTPND